MNYYFWAILFLDVVTSAAIKKQKQTQNILIMLSDNENIWEKMFNLIIE